MSPILQDHIEAIAVAPAMAYSSSIETIQKEPERQSTFPAFTCRPQPSPRPLLRFRRLGGIRITLNRASIDVVRPRWLLHHQVTSAAAAATAIRASEAAAAAWQHRCSALEAKATAAMAATEAWHHRSTVLEACAAAWQHRSMGMEAAAEAWRHRSMVLEAELSECELHLHQQLLARLVGGLLLLEAATSVGSGAAASAVGGAQLSAASASAEARGQLQARPYYLAANHEKEAGMGGPAAAAAAAAAGTEGRQLPEDRGVLPPQQGQDDEASGTGAGANDLLPVTTRCCCCQQEDDEHASSPRLQQRQESDALHKAASAGCCCCGSVVVAAAAMVVSHLGWPPTEEEEQCRLAGLEGQREMMLMPALTEESRAGREGQREVALLPMREQLQDILCCCSSWASRVVYPHPSVLGGGDRGLGSVIVGAVEDGITPPSATRAGSADLASVHLHPTSLLSQGLQQLVSDVMQLGPGPPTHMYNNSFPAKRQAVTFLPPLPISTCLAFSRIIH